MSTTSIADSCGNLKLIPLFLSFKGSLLSLLFLMPVDKLFEVSHGLDFSGTGTRKVLARSGKSLRSLSGDGSLGGVLTSRSEFGDLGDESRNVRLLDTLALSGDALNLRLDVLSAVTSGRRSLIGLEETVRIQNSSLALLESEVGEGLAGSKLEDTVGLNVTLARELGDVGKRLVLEAGSDTRALSVIDVLVNKRFHLVISVDILGMSVQGDAARVVSGELVDDQFELNTTVGGEDVLRFDSGELKRPVLDGDDLGSQVSDVGIGARLEFIDGLLGEVARNVEVVIGDEEVRVRFLDIALDGGLSDLVGNLGEVTTVLEDG